MTEQNNPTPEITDTTPATEPTLASDKTAAKKSSVVNGVTLGAVAIAIALALGAGLWVYGQHQASQQQAASEALKNQLAALQQQQAQSQTKFDETQKQQASQLDEMKQQRDAMAHQLDELQQKVATISGSDAHTWLLAQADYLVKLAGRKLWSDQDVATAAALLKSADASLADMNDPSLITARRALTEDISTLSAISQVDYDGIILKLNQLANQVDNLNLADNDTNDSPMDEDSNELSGSVHEWRANLVKSWHSFMDSFLTIRRRDSTDVPLLAPNQDIYLRENIRSRLLIAAQAVPRHQNEIYQQSLENVSTWVRAYYDTSDSTTKAFLAGVDSLSQQTINMDVPQSLQSQPLLEKLMQTRVRNLLAQPSVPAGAATGDTTTAPAEAQGE